MALADETWLSATHAEVCLAFLKAEWEKVPEITRWHDRQLVDSPDLANGQENSLRRLILGSWREALLAYIPADTSWWRVRSLQHTHITELLVIASEDWRNPMDRNELLNVARRSGKPLRIPPEHWSPPILWGHERQNAVDGGSRNRTDRHVDADLLHQPSRQNPSSTCDGSVGPPFLVRSNFNPHLRADRSSDASRIRLG